ncbi:TetR/AcrR family transcriptional regulator [Paraburkholderia sp. BCC1885]|uniref:TetR/AcrR family transcriptional regulator n=1 Tax=Paraburkholderia sp. BCC1885 TaxID=2562669 RepID=UPI001642A214|nr:TetR/AcrR family transcriptional regulator [Paraburkholderia sp. BCC1885]
MEHAALLFYRHGFNAVSVDQIAQAVGTHKMSVYRQFASKDELALAYVAWASRLASERWNDLKLCYPDRPLEQIAAYFTVLCQEMLDTDYDGDALLKFSLGFTDLNHPVRQCIDSGRAILRERFGALAACAGVTDPSRFVEELCLLWHLTACPGRTSSELRRHADMVQKMVSRLLCVEC